MNITLDNKYWLRFFTGWIATASLIAISISIWTAPHV